MMPQNLFNGTCTGALVARAESPGEWIADDAKNETDFLSTGSRCKSDARGAS